MRHRKVMTLAVLCLVLCAPLSLVSCGLGIDSDEAKEFISDFFDAVKSEDYEKAETFLHPDRPADLETNFRTLEEKGNVDFSTGITIAQYTGISTVLYDSTVDGSSYTLSLIAIVDGYQIPFTIEIVKNDNGYGIYNLRVN